MSDEINKNVINMFSQHNNDRLSAEAKNRVKYYAGFNYVKLKKDTNGNKFNKDNLLNYASKCHYMVTVMRELNGEIILYSYDVPNSDLFKKRMMYIMDLYIYIFYWDFNIKQTKYKQK